MSKYIEQSVFEQAVKNIVEMEVAGEGIDISTEDHKKVFSVSNPYPGIDDKTIQLKEGLISAAIDSETIIYNADKRWMQVNHEPVYFEDGLKEREEENGLHVSVKPDNDTIFINSEGEVCATQQIPEIDGGSGLIVIDGKLSLSIDEDTIVYNSEEEWIEVPYKGIYTKYPLYMKDSEQAVELGILIDSETLVLNDHHELSTVIGGGWKKSLGSMVIASEGSVKIRHHRLPDDNADYDLVTVNFPDVDIWGGAIECTVESDIAGLEDIITLHWDSNRQVWVGVCGKGDKDKPNIIVVRQDGAKVLTGNEFEAAQEVGNCKITANEIPREKIFIDSKFIKVDEKTIIVNSEGALEAVKQFEFRTALEESEGIVDVRVDSETVFVNEDNQLYIKEATDTQLGVVRIDNDTIRSYDQTKIFTDFAGHIDNDLEYTNNKITHANKTYANTVGRDLAYTQVSYDNNGHITGASDHNLSTMQPATSTVDGYKGLVPTPRKGDQTKFLTGAGTWESVASASLFNVVVNEASVAVGPNNAFIRVVAPTLTNQKIIAPLGFIVKTRNPYVENIECVYATEMGEDAITVCARSMAGTVDVSISGYWLVINL